MAAALRLGRSQTPVHGLIDIDVTGVRDELARLDSPVTFTTFVLGSLGQVLARHPAVHAYRDWRGRLVYHDRVDIAVMAEVPTDSGTFPAACVVRDCDARSLEDIGRALDRARSTGQTTGRRFPRALTAIPGLAQAFFWMLGHTRSGRARAGTAALSAIGMFGDAGGFGIPAPTIYTVSVLVGTIAPRPTVIDGEVAVRDMVDVTLTFDHRLVDGAPAARFATDLRSTIEKRAVLRPS